MAQLLSPLMISLQLHLHFSFLYELDMRRSGVTCSPLLLASLSEGLWNPSPMDYTLHSSLGASDWQDLLVRNSSVFPGQLPKFVTYITWTLVSTC